MGKFYKGAYPANGADPFLQEALGSFMERVCVGCLSQKDIEAPEVGLPVEDVPLVIDTLIVDVQLVEVLSILEVVLITSSLQDSRSLLSLDNPRSADCDSSSLLQV